MGAASTLTTFRAMTGGVRLLPDFIIVGAQKCGTSSLYRYLASHPTVAPAARKEVHYFDWAFGRGTNWYRAHFVSRFYRASFEARTRRKLTVGEASPYYLFHPHVPKRVGELLPGVKLIALLRDPVERAFSAYHHQVRRGREHLSFPDAIDAEPSRLAGELERLARDETYNSPVHRNFSYLARGLYAEQLEAWFRMFPREQLLVIRSEEFFDHTAEVFGQVLDFLELDRWQPPFYRQFNAAEYGAMDPAVRQRLVAYFAPHNQRLYDLMGRDFGWSR